MKPTLVLLADSATIMEVHARIRQLGVYVEREFFDSLSVDACTLGIDASGDVLDEYEPGELEALRARFDDLAALLVEYASEECVVDVVRRATRGLDGVVDDNVRDLQEFAGYVQRRVTG